jgi:hypothetical protein
MTKDEIVRLAHEADDTIRSKPFTAEMLSLLERFATLCRAPLVAENEGLKESFESVLSQLKERDAELEQAKKDAERYQWLRKSHHDDDSAIGVTREHMNGWGRVVGKSLRNSDLDKAIDEALDGMVSAINSRRTGNDIDQ